MARFRCSNGRTHDTSLDWRRADNHRLAAQRRIIALLHGNVERVHIKMPACHRRLLLPYCGRPRGNPFSIVISLLIGAWTHLLLDSITHPDGWLVTHLPVLPGPVISVGQQRFMACEILCAGFTFSGVAWLAFCYLHW